MEAYQGDPLAAPWRLTKLYTDAKKSYTSVSPPVNSNEAPEILSLHRKFRIQKDRLIAWGLEWTDDGSSNTGKGGSPPHGGIDEAIERAGLTEVVGSVMENIKGILDEVDALRARTAPRRPVNAPAAAVAAATVAYPVDKPTGVWTSSDKAHYEDLVKDLTRAIDLLCDLSKHRKVSRPSSPSNSISKGHLHTAAPAPANTFTGPAAYDYTSFTPSSADPYATLPAYKSGPLITPRIARVDLALPEEGPPPYNAIGNVRPSRTVGRLRHQLTTTPAGSKRPKLEKVEVPVMIEDACYDSIYQNSNIPLPMNRLDQLYTVSKAQGDSSSSTTNTNLAIPRLIGCWEYPHEPRFGLIYELPPAVHSTTLKSGDIQNNGPIISLFQLLENASKLQPHSGNTPTMAIPPLEERFRLALELVSSFAELHKHSFTHQGFSSSSVALFPRPQDSSSSSTPRTVEYNVRRPLITSFDVFSEYNIDSPPEMLHENLYRHPDDPRMKGPSAAENFHPNCDLYSLGLVLLEIGLWHPLSDIFKEKYTLKDFQTRVEKIWIRRLAGRCGTAYMRAVQDCISVGNESPSSADALAQVYNRIKTRLHRCCLLDDEFDEIDSILDREPARSPLADETVSPTMSKMDSMTSLARQGTTVSSFGASLRNDTLAPSPARFGSDVKIDPTRDIYQEPSSLPGTAKASQENLAEQQDLSKKARFRFPEKKLPAEVLDIWNNALEQRLARIVTKALQNTRESCEVFICYTGESEATAKPTACVMCSSTKLVRAAIRRFFQYDSQQFDVAVIKGKIMRSKAVRKSTANVRRAAAASNASSDPSAMNPFHHQRPLCGASIGAYRDSEHMPPVSFGGVVMVDGDSYGMSVHHLIEDPEEDDYEDGSGLPIRAMAPPISTAPRQLASPMSGPTTLAPQLQQPAALWAEAFEESDDEGDMSDLDSVLGPGSDIDDLMSEYSFSGTDGDDVDNGDTEGVMVGDGDEIIITQPALNDVSDDFFPCEEDKDDDHLDSHSLGHVHASSGLRRCTRQGVQHEVDWALLKLNDSRNQTYNLVAGGKRFCRSNSASSFRPKLLDPICRREFPASEDLYPRHIVRSEQLSGLDVHCFGRTSGLQQGRISQTMRLVRFHGRRTFSRTWSVNGDFGVGGDSGAWVIDNTHGRVCGHVLAWSSTLGTAYISPMDITFDDIRQTLRARKVCLPGGEDETDSVDDDRRSELDGNEVLEGVDPSAAGAGVGAGARLVDTDAMAAAPLQTHLGGLSLKDSRAGSDRGDVKSPYLLSNHMLFSGNPDHMEREWTTRRAHLGASFSITS